MDEQQMRINTTGSVLRTIVLVAFESILLLGPAAGQDTTTQVSWAQVRDAIEGTICVGWMKKFGAYSITFSPKCDPAPPTEVELQAIQSAVAAQEGALAGRTKKFGENTLFTQDGDGYRTSAIYNAGTDNLMHATGILILEPRSKGKVLKGEANIQAIRQAYVESFFANAEAMRTVMPAVQAALAERSAACSDCPQPEDPASP